MPKPTSATNPMNHAACIGHPDPDAWFPDHDSPGGNHGRAARAVCAGCPALEPCLVAALQRRETHGIWGGAGEPRRRVLRPHLGTARWPAMLAAHRRGLVGAGSDADRGLLDGTGEGVTHGRRVTYARGCRCGACTSAAAAGTAMIAVTGPRRRQAA